VGRPISRPERKVTAPSPSRPKLRQGPVARRGHWPIWLLLGMLSAAGAVASAFWFQEGPWLVSMLNRSQTVVPDPQTDRPAWRADKFGRKEERPQLIVKSSGAAVNQPLPLGIVLNNSTGEETLVLSGLIEGTSLSAGTALGTTRWSVPARDLDRAFISPPQDFNDIMQVTVTLYSSTQEVLEAKHVGFEWSSSRKGDKLPVTTLPSQGLAR
jgi:hypothetical protein